MGSELFYPYQQRWISNDSRFKIGMFARQTGKTFTTTFEIARDCQLADLAGKRQRWVILSRGERQAKEAIEEGVKRHCQALGSLVRTVEGDWRTDGASYRALEVEFPGGSKITALPANPDTARGFSANQFRLAMSRNEIGNYLGLAVETVSRVFTRFQQNKLLEAEGKEVHILDPIELCALAGGNLDV